MDNNKMKMFLSVVYIFVVVTSIQSVEAVRQPKSFPITMSVSGILKNLEDLLSDVMETLNNVLSPPNIKKAIKEMGNNWGIERVIEYGAKKVRKGINTIQQSIIFLDMARSFIDGRVDFSTLVSNLIQIGSQNFAEQNGQMALPTRTHLEYF